MKRPTHHTCRSTIGVLLLFMVLSTIPAQAIQVLRVNLRLYEGIRDQSVDKPEVISSYYLKTSPHSARHRQEESRECREIKRIYNLNDVSLISEADWWGKHDRGARFQATVLNENPFHVRLRSINSKDTFLVEIVDQRDAEIPPIFESQFVLPEGKTIVFGFEHPSQRLYFVSLSRASDSRSTRDAPVKLPINRLPRLRHMEKPNYPAIALQSRVEGSVVLEVTTDEDGDVAAVRIVRGHPKLNSEAVRAIQKWKYEPYLVNGKPRAVVIRVTIRFRLLAP